MAHQNRSQQQTELAKLRSEREPMFRKFCAHYAVTHAVALIEDDGIIYAEADQLRWVVHQALDKRRIWFETWQILHDDATCLKRYTASEKCQSFSVEQVGGANDYRCLVSVTHGVVEAVVVAHL